MIEMRRLNQAGLDRFALYLSQGAKEPVEHDWLHGEEYSEGLEQNWSIDPARKFADRFEFAQYVWQTIEGEWSTSYEHDVGFWTWLALLYFDQFRPADRLSHAEHYIYDPHRFANYRHCAAMPVKLSRDFGTDARIFLTNSMSSMGDMLEQCMSRQYLMRSTTFRQVVRKLYFDETHARLKTGATSRAAKRKLSNGKWSTAGAGSVRRLALEVLRLNLAFNLEAMSADEVIGLLGKEYAKFRAPSGATPDGAPGASPT